MKTILLIAALFTLSLATKPQSLHPHILVRDSEKAGILKKINELDWAKNISSGISDIVTPYVERHVTDPEWILSRYQMNRVPGKRFTRVISDNGGLRVIRYEGDAPVPTIRVGSHIRVPVTASGYSYLKPSIDDIVPYDTSRFMMLYNTETKQKELIDPQAFTGDINSDINNLALDAALVYWLKGDIRYAKFAADILDQWVKGAFYMEPVIGPCRTGFLNLQTLGEGEYRSLILAYDFLFPFMKQNGYDLHYYEPVFEKIASTLAFRGFWNNNWYAAESSTMVFAALSMENKEKREYYLQFFLSKDTINNGCGQLALPSTVAKWLTPDGHWKEPGGYHNYPVSNLLYSSLALEKNGYDIFGKFPALFRASYAMLKYSFPDLTVSAFGDTGRASQDAQSLEIGIVGAIKYNQPELPEMIASMKKLIDGGKYKRENSGFLGLLCFMPELPQYESEYTWPRGGTLDFAKYYLQRNGMDPVYGLMYGVQGATYNHNHCNGMAMEIYGMGEVMGIDAGPGATYEHPLHVKYYSQWAAHNTVAAAGSSSSVPVSGSAGTKNIGQISLAAMEPRPDKAPVSDNYSFTDTRYTDISTGTNQMRTMGLIRTSGTTGYYIDIYRSDNAESNDYIYHNIGDSLQFLDSNRKPIRAVPAEYPLKGNDNPGFRFFKKVQKAESRNEDMIALFSAQNNKQENINMQLLIPSKTGRDYYRAFSLKTKTAGRYSGKELPVFTMRDNGESWNKPFIVVFEPYKGESGFSVERVSAEKRDDGKDFTALTVFNRNGSKQIIFQSVDGNKIFLTGDGTFAGHLGIADFKGNRIKALYLGEGNEINYGGYSLRTEHTGSGEIKIEEKKLTISCNQSTIIGIPSGKVKKISFYDGAKTVYPGLDRKKETIYITVPEVKNGVIYLE